MSHSVVSLQKYIEAPFFQRDSLSYTGPKILLYTLLSKTFNCFLSLFVSVQVSNILFILYLYCTDKILRIISRICIHSWFCLLNYMSYSSRSNFAKAGRTCTKTWTCTAQEQLGIWKEFRASKNLSTSKRNVHLLSLLFITKRRRLI